MWKERLEEIRQEEKKYGADINGGVSAEEAQAFVKAVKDELGIALPEEYLKILRTINGIEFILVNEINCQVYAACFISLFLAENVFSHTETKLSYS